MRLQNRTIRMIYISMGKHYNPYQGEYMFEKELAVLPHYLIPDGLSLQEACEVLSYLSNRIEQDNNIEPASLTSVKSVCKVLSKYGFKKIEDNKSDYYHSHITYEWNPLNKEQYSSISEIDGVTDIITYRADDKIFKKSDMAERYFDWYTEDVSQHRFKELINKISNLNIDEQFKI